MIMNNKLTIEQAKILLGMGLDIRRLKGSKRILYHGKIYDSLGSLLEANNININVNTLQAYKRKYKYLTYEELIDSGLVPSATGKVRYATGKTEKWSQEEDALIKKLYPIGEIETLNSLLPNRSQQAIYRRAIKIGAKQRIFPQRKRTTGPIEYNGVKYNGIKQLCDHFGFKSSTIRRHAKIHKKSIQETIDFYLNNPPVYIQRIPFTPEEDEIICKYYQNIGSTKIHSLYLPNRGVDVITKRARILGIATPRHKNK